jgi:hypothetical protein
MSHLLISIARRVILHFANGSFRDPKIPASFLADIAISHTSCVSVGGSSLFVLRCGRFMRRVKYEGKIVDVQARAMSATALRLSSGHHCHTRRYFRRRHSYHGGLAVELDCRTIINASLQISVRTFGANRRRGGVFPPGLRSIVTRVYTIVVATSSTM